MDHRAPDAADLRVAVDRDLEIPDLISLLRGGDEMLAAILDPFHRTLEQDRNKSDDELLGIENQLGPEPSPNVGRDDANGFLLASEHFSDQAHCGMWRLRGAPDRQLILDRIVDGHASPAFNRLASAPRLLKRLAKDVLGAAEGLLDVAERQFELRDDIVRCVAMCLWRAGCQRGPAIDDRLQRLILNLDGGDRVLGLMPGLRNNHRDGSPTYTTSSTASTGRSSCWRKALLGNATTSRSALRCGRMSANA